MTSPGALRDQIREAHLADESDVVRKLIADANLSEEVRRRAVQRAIRLIKEIREEGKSGLLEVFLAEYSLSTDEGIALMCLAEALLRVEDTQTIDALIEDKIAPSSWVEHLGHSSSPLVNASTWALMLTGIMQRDYDSDGLAGILRGAVKRVGEPVIRSAVKRAMKELGKQFVLGRTIEEAVRSGSARAEEGYTFSYDMLGETALTARDALSFFKSYKNAIKTLGTATPCGLFACISPWNFPLAIFTGQIAAALAAGNGVLAKPSELTPITASVAVRLLHDAGVPLTVLQLLSGSGPVVGAKLTSDPRIDGICFTGSTATAQTINRAMAAGGNASLFATSA